MAGGVDAENQKFGAVFDIGVSRTALGGANRAQFFADGDVGYADDAAVLQIAGCGRRAGRLQNGRQHFVGNGFGGKAADGTVRQCGLQGGTAVQSHGLLLVRWIGKGIVTE